MDTGTNAHHIPRCKSPPFAAITKKAPDWKSDNAFCSVNAKSLLAVH